MAHHVLVCARHERVVSFWRRPAAVLLPAGLVVATGVLTPRAAEACRNNDHPVYTIGELTPAPGSSDVARDAGIIIRAAASPAAGGPATFADVALIDVETGAPVPLSPVSWMAFDSSQPMMAFRPTEPLAAWRDYRVEVTPFDEVNGGFGALVSSSFTTSDALLEPVVLSGEFVFSLRAGEVDVWEGGGCGDGGRLIGQHPVLYADVQLPAPSGGQGVYHGAMHFTDDTPARVDADYIPEVEGWEDGGLHRFHSMHYAHVDAGESVSLTQIIFDEDFAYAGCFNFAVWDPAGNLAQTAACLPRLTPEEIRTLAAGADTILLSTDETVAADQVDAAVVDAALVNAAVVDAAVVDAAVVDAAVVDAGRPDRGPVLGCALAARQTTSLPPWLALLPAIFLGRRLASAARGRRRAHERRARPPLVAVSQEPHRSLDRQTRRYGSTRGALLAAGARSARGGWSPSSPTLAGVFAAALLAPAPADACGARSPSAFSITAVSPAAGALGVARDTGIIVSGVATPAIPGERLGAEVELIDLESGLAVALREVGWYSGEGAENALALHPVEPLAALHEYRVEARPRDEATAELGTAVVSTFSTSDAIFAPLVLSGELGLSLRGGEVDVIEQGPCGAGAAIGKRRALLADVQLPTPSGGQGVYRATLSFTRDTPALIDAHDPWSFRGVQFGFHESQYVDVQGGPRVVSREVFDLDTEYVGCFTFAVWDPAGNVAQTAACLPSLTSEEIRALAEGDDTTELATDDAVAADQVDAALADAGRPDRGPVWSCALGAPPSAHRPAWLALLLGSLLVLRSSGKRRR